MSATEAEHANQTVVESVPVELNVDSPDITTDIVALKETTDIDPKDTDAIQFDLKDASEAGTTQDSIGEIPESLESTEALDGSKIPTIPEKVADTTKDANTTLPSFEGNVDALTGAESEKYGLDEVEVVEEKSHEASHAPLGSAEPVSAEDALTITTEVASTVTPTAGENDATQDVAVADSPAPDPLSFVQEQDVPHVPAAQEENGAAEDSQLASREAEVTFVEEAPNTKVEEDIVRQSDARIKQDASDDLVIEASEDNSMDATAETSFIDSGSVADESLTEIVFAEAEPKAPFEDDLVLQEAQLETADQPSAVDDSTQADAETPVEILSTNPLVVDSVTEITEDQEQSPIETAEAGGLVEGQPLDDTDVSRLLTPREPEVERPKSPWTPSYSVTTQGPGIPASDDLELAELPVLPPPVDVKQLGTNQDDHLETVPVLEQTERTVTVTSVQDVEAEVPPSSEPPRPWTPSYSVVVQGSPLSPPVNLVAQEESTIVGEDNLHSASQDGPNPDIVAPIPDGNPAMVSLINSGIVVDPATLQDPDVEDDSVDPGSEAVVAALIESGVLADDAVAVDQDDSPIATLVSVTTAQDFIDENQAPANPEFSSAPEVQITTDVQATEKMTFDEVPQIETHLTTAQSEPERPRSPWTPSYSVTQHGQISPDGRSESGEVAAPTSKQEMLSAEQQSFIEPVLEISVLETSLNSPRASSPWTPSYSVSIQGSPLPVSAELAESELQADDLVLETPVVVAAVTVDSIPEAVVDVSALEAPLDPPRASSPWTPSYSVSVQGSPLPVPTELAESELQGEDLRAEIPAEVEVDPIPEETLATTALESANSTEVQVVVVQESIPEAVVDVSALEAPPDPPRASSPWTPSYSVSVQGSPLPVPTELAESELQGEDLDAEIPAEVEVDPIPEATLATTAQESANGTGVQVVIVQESVPEAVVDVSALEAPLDPPRAISPWTPSYSVSVQGSLLPVPTELAESELQREDLDAEIPAEVEVDPIPEATLAITAQESANGPGVQVVIVQESIPEAVVDVSALEAPLDPPRASSPWIPSYSVLVQGSPLPVTTELAESELQGEDLDAEIPAEVEVDPIPEATLATTALESANGAEVVVVVVPESAQDADSEVVVATELTPELGSPEVIIPVAESTPSVQTVGAEEPLEDSAPIIDQSASTGEEVVDIVAVDFAPALVEVSQGIVVESVPIVEGVDAPTAEELFTDNGNAEAPVEEEATVVLLESAEFNAAAINEDTSDVVSQLMAIPEVEALVGEDMTIPESTPINAHEEDTAAETILPVEDAPALADVEDLGSGTEATPVVEVEVVSQDEAPQGSREYADVSEDIPVVESHGESTDAPVEKIGDVAVADSVTVVDAVQVETIAVPEEALKHVDTTEDEAVPDSVSAPVPEATLLADVTAQADTSDPEASVHAPTTAEFEGVVPSDEVVTIEEPPASLPVSEHSSVGESVVQTTSAVTDVIPVDEPAPVEIAFDTIVVDEVVHKEVVPDSESVAPAIVLRDEATIVGDEETSTVPQADAVESTSTDEATLIQPATASVLAESEQPEQIDAETPVHSVEDTVDIAAADPADGQADEESQFRSTLKEHQAIDWVESAPTQVIADAATAEEQPVAVPRTIVESAVVEETTAEAAPSTTSEPLPAAEPSKDKVTDIAQEIVTIPVEEIHDPNTDASTQESLAALGMTSAAEEPNAVIETVVEMDSTAQDAIPPADDTLMHAIDKTEAVPEVNDAPPTVSESVAADVAPSYGAVPPATHSDGVEPSIAVVDTEEPADEATPVPSVVPLPAELPSQAFPTMLNIPRSSDAGDDANDSHLDPPLSPRSRLESTASSLFFPGGWFSKIPQGRTSLDVAQGEFAPSNPASPSIHSPINEADHSEEKKGKWCVVM